LFLLKFIFSVGLIRIRKIGFYFFGYHVQFIVQTENSFDIEKDLKQTDVFHVITNSALVLEKLSSTRAIHGFASEYLANGIVAPLY
jgi:hypothetical protein